MAQFKNFIPGEKPIATETDKFGDVTFNEVDAIIRYEEGDLDEEETVQLFQHLVDNGHAWTLQGHYGRVAMSLIRAGKIQARG